MLVAGSPQFEPAEHRRRNESQHDAAGDEENGARKDPHEQPPGAGAEDRPQTQSRLSVALLSPTSARSVWGATMRVRGRDGGDFSVGVPVFTRAHKARGERKKSGAWLLCDHGRYDRAMA